MNIRIYPNVKIEKVILYFALLMYPLISTDLAHALVLCNEAPSSANGYLKNIYDYYPGSCPKGWKLAFNFDKFNTTATALVGPKGNKGNTGPKGPKGDKGNTGPKGNVGPTGAKGNTGEKGPKGDTGPIGLKGNTGATGAKGNAGPIGPKGVAGNTGPKGETGAVGPKGATGATGPRGLTGSKGAQGIPGIIDLANCRRATDASDSSAENTKSVLAQCDSETEFMLNYGYATSAPSGQIIVDSGILVMNENYPIGVTIQASKLNTAEEADLDWELTSEIICCAK